MFGATIRIRLSQFAAAVSPSAHPMLEEPTRHFSEMIEPNVSVLLLLMKILPSTFELAEVIVGARVV